MTSYAAVDFKPKYTCQLPIVISLKLIAERLKRSSAIFMLPIVCMYIYKKTKFSAYLGLKADPKLCKRLL
jgi:hypothetical protein